MERYETEMVKADNPADAMMISKYNIGDSYIVIGHQISPSTDQPNVWEVTPIFAKEEP